jgi:serine/threonine protein kinase
MLIKKTCNEMKWGADNWWIVYQKWQLHEPRTLQIQDFDVETKTMTYEWIEGTSLGNRKFLIDLPIDTKRKIFADYIDLFTCQLKFTHELFCDGEFWLHNDYKPDNIIVDHKENIHCIDVGVFRPKAVIDNGYLGKFFESCMYLREAMAIYQD